MAKLSFMPHYTETNFSICSVTNLIVPCQRNVKYIMHFEISYRSVFLDANTTCWLTAAARAAKITNSISSPLRNPWREKISSHIIYRKRIRNALERNLILTRARPLIRRACCQLSIHLQHNFNWSKIRRFHLPTTSREQDLYVHPERLKPPKP